MLTQKHGTWNMVRDISVCRQNHDRIEPMNKQTMSQEWDNDLSDMATTYKFDSEIVSMTIVKLILYNEISFNNVSPII